MNLSTVRVALLGSGNMGAAVLAGALRAGVSPANLTATGLDTEALTALETRFGTPTSTDNSEAVAGAGLVIVAVKPGDVAALLEEIRDNLPPDAIIVSVAAGLSTGYVERRLPPGQAVIRVMPNTPAAIGAGMAGLSAGQNASPDDVELALAVLSGTGEVSVIDEKYQAALGALSGSGPAYVFYVIDALAEAGVAAGLGRSLSLHLARQTVLGAAKLLVETGEHPALARERVSSPGGTTVEALRVLDAAGVRAAFVDAVAAAVTRTQEIAAQLD
ncbi:MAG: pyrroline-5-carboxylate reductase [Cellulomonadaceae bacterium]|jgi:pyrroline-5-carboxylate reductase|nr:pyrroline-5-carboxylate reductase [Cellulomonadaceae bacterium]